MHRSTHLFFATILFILFTTTPVVRAQYSTAERTAMTAAATAFDAQWRAERAEAEILARIPGLPLRVERADGRVIELQRYENGRPRFYATTNADAARAISTDRVQPGGSAGMSLTGAGETLGEWDAAAARASHQEFGGRVTQGDGVTSLHAHSTHVGGTMVASGVKAQARGMAPAARLRAFDWNNDAAEMLSEASTGLQVSNHSYTSVAGWYYNFRGDGRWAWLGNTTLNAPDDADFGLYDSRAAQWDQIAALSPYYLIVKAAGNDRGEGPASQPVSHWELVNNSWTLRTTVRALDGGTLGYDCLPTFAVAKNVLTVGAVEDLLTGYTTASGVRMSSFSGWGPADDGRIKPDISANGVSVYSSVESSNSAYATYNGTSMAAPSVAGSIGLLNEHWKKLRGAGVKLRSASVKALLVHTADEAGPAPGPDYMFGWGLMNTLKCVRLMSSAAQGSTSARILEQTLANTGSIDIPVFSPGRGPLRVTICWTDPAGTALPEQANQPTPVLVNDLDLRVTAPGGAAQLPWRLDRANPTAAAARADNAVDNVEQVLIDAPVEGDYIVHITHKGSLKDGSQAVSIIITVGNEPALVSPPNGLTEVTVTPTLQWSPVSGALSYRVQLSTVPDFTSLVADASGVTSADWTPAALTPLTRYYWRVLVTDARGSSDWSETWSFTTGGAVTAAGHALHFDGKDDVLQSPHAAEYTQIESGNAITIEGWVRIASMAGGAFPVLEKRTAAGGTAWGLRVTGTALQFLNGTASAVTASVPTGGWHHVAAAYSKSEGKVRFYVDGASVGTSTLSANLVSSGDGALILGASLYAGEKYAQGAMDEMRIWRTARSETEIRGTMDARLNGTESGLSALFHCDEARGMTAVNSGPSAAPASLLRGPVWLVSTIPVARPAPPQLLSPLNDVGGIPLQPALSWQPSTSAMSYRVQVSEYSSFSGTVMDQGSLTATSATAPTLKPETRYWWRVNASNSVGVSDWSETRSFLTAVAPPPAPVLSAPADKALNQPVLVTLLWQTAPRAQTYHVQAATDSTFRDGILVDMMDLPTPAFEVHDLGNNTKYYWHVRAANMGGYGPWSELRVFTTVPLPPDPPRLTEPARDAVGVPRSPQFRWEKPDGAQTYAMQLSEDSLFTSKLIDARDIPMALYAASDLKESTRYWWRVSAKNTAGESSWSEIWSFITARPVPTDAVQLRAPDNGARDVPVQPEFRWDAVTNAGGYELQVSLRDDFLTMAYTRSAISGITHTPMTALAANTTYHWRVRAANESGNAPWSTVWSLTTGDLPLAAPVLLAPSDGASGISAPLDLRWAAVTRAERYDAQVATDPAFTTGVIDVQDIATTTTSIPTLPTGSTCYWRVRAENATQIGPWSMSRSFRTLPALPGAPVLLLPSRDENLMSKTVTFSWERCFPLVQRYHIEIRGDMQWSDSTVVDSVVQQTVYGAHCTWRVRARNAAGWGPWSEERGMTPAVLGTEQAAVPARTPAIDAVYPQPADASLGVRMTMPAPGFAVLELRDLAGRVVHLLHRGVAPAGSSTFTVGTATLRTGVYILQLRCDGATTSHRITVLH